MDTGLSIYNNITPAETNRDYLLCATNTAEWIIIVANLCFKIQLKFTSSVMNNNSLLELSTQPAQVPRSACPWRSLLSVEHSSSILLNLLLSDVMFLINSREGDARRHGDKEIDHWGKVSVFTSRKRRSSTELTTLFLLLLLPALSDHPFPLSG